MTDINPNWGGGGEIGNTKLKLEFKKEQGGDINLS